jgi:signal transduction histidine kinase
MAGSPVIVEPSAELLEAMAELAAGAGHEINNPLGTIVGRAQRLLKDESSPEKRTELLAIMSQAYRVRDMIGDLMTFARPAPPQPVEFSLADVVRSACRGLTDSIEAARCDFLVRELSDEQLFGDPVQFAVVLTELIKNALSAVPPAAGRVVLAARRLDSEPRTIRLTLTDNGTGFTPEQARLAFSPFYSGRQAGRGLGFGLCKAWQVVRQNGGRLRLLSAISGPTTAELDWPVSIAATGPGVPPASEIVSPDDPPVR